MSTKQRVNPLTAGMTLLYVVRLLYKVHRTRDGNRFTCVTYMSVTYLKEKPLNMLYIIILWYLVH